MKLRETLKQIMADNAFYGGSNLTKKVGVYLLEPGFRMVMNYRLGKYFLETRSGVFKLFVRYLRLKQVVKRGCQFSFKATIGNNFKMPHAIGIVIGEGVIIKDNVTIFQNVTLGRSHGNADGLCYPVIGNNVTIFAGAKIFGGVAIGANAKIGANAVVNIDVPENCIAVGVPAKILSK